MKTKFTKLLLLVLVIGSFSVMAQDRSITGKVQSQNGEALPGVSVLVKGTTAGTTTNADGVFTINANDNSVLVFSSVGMIIQQKTVGNRANISITMIDRKSTRLNSSHVD